MVKLYFFSKKIKTSGDLELEPPNIYKKENRLSTIFFGVTNDGY